MASQAIEAGRAFLKLLIDDTEFNKGLDRSLRKLDNFANSVGKFGAALATIASPAFFAGALAAGIEKSAAALGVFTGNAEVARDILEELQEFSAISLIPFENLSSQVALLIRYGIAVEDATAFTKALTIVAAGNAEEFDKLSLAFAQVAGAGRLQGEEMRQLKNTAFNPLREIAERTGETMEEVRSRMEAGGVSFEEVGKALIAATSDGGRFGGLLEEISRTTAGQFSLAKAQVNLLATAIGKDLLTAANAALRGFNDLLKIIRDVTEANDALRKSIAILATVTIGWSAAAIAVAGSIKLIIFAVGGLRVALAFLAANPVVAAMLAFAAVLSLVLTALGYINPATEELDKRLKAEADAARKAAEQQKFYEDSLKQTTTAIDDEARALGKLTDEQRKSLKLYQEIAAEAKATAEAEKLVIQAALGEAGERRKIASADVAFHEQKPDIAERITGKTRQEAINDLRLISEELRRLEARLAALDKFPEGKPPAQVPFGVGAGGVGIQQFERLLPAEILTRFAALAERMKFLQEQLGRAFTEKGFLGDVNEIVDEIRKNEEEQKKLREKVPGLNLEDLLKSEEVRTRSPLATFSGRLASQILGDGGEQSAAKRDRKEQLKAIRESRDFLRIMARKTFLLRTGPK